VSAEFLIPLFVWGPAFVGGCVVFALGARRLVRERLADRRFDRELAELLAETPLRTRGRLPR
jgi:hypothetical protein